MASTSEVGAMQLQVGAACAEAARHDVAIDKAGAVINDDVSARCKDRRPPLGADKVALPIVSDIIRRLRRAGHRSETNGAATLEDDERTTLVIRLRSGVEELVHVVRVLGAAEVRAALIDDVNRICRSVGRPVGACLHRADERLGAAAIDWGALANGRRVARRVPVVVGGRGAVCKALHPRRRLVDGNWVADRARRWIFEGAVDSDSATQVVRANGSVAVAGDG